MFERYRGSYLSWYYYSRIALTILVALLIFVGLVELDIWEQYKENAQIKAGMTIGTLPGIIPIGIFTVEDVHDHTIYAPIDISIPDLQSYKIVGRQYYKGNLCGFTLIYNTSLSKNNLVPYECESYLKLPIAIDGIKVFSSP